MFSSTHPYIFDPIPSLVSNNSIEGFHMSFSDIQHLLPNYNKVENVRGNRYKDKHVQQETNAFNPHVFYLLVKPNEDYKMLPELFSFKYASTISDKVNLRDPAGNVNIIKVIKWDHEICLTHEWKKLVPFYGLYGGGSLRMTYIGVGLFDIKVFNHYDKEVSYPSSEQAMRLGYYQKLGNNMNKRPFRQPLNPAKFLFTTPKSNDFEEAIGLKLKLPKVFVDKALRKDNGEVTIVDEYLKPWHCQLTHKVADPLSSWITSGWGTFLTAKELHFGDKFLLGVMSDNSTVLYYILSSSGVS